MTKIILCGCFGRMGTAITNLAAAMDDIQIVAGVDTLETSEMRNYPVYHNINNCSIQADVIISILPSPAIAATMELLDYTATNRVPLVNCTTGLPQHVLNAIADTAKTAAVLHSANMSLGVNLLTNILVRVSKLLYNSQFDIEIVEKHHNKKVDAPSGTAVLLADTINHALGGDMRVVTDRSTTHEERGADEIGVYSVRGGNIVGEHSVLFAGANESIEITHTAHSRDVFAAGALKAARFMKGKDAGLYTMQDLIDAL